jgi:hypothetical protein
MQLAIADERDDSVKKESHVKVSQITQEVPFNGPNGLKCYLSLYKMIV